MEQRKAELIKELIGLQKRLGHCLHRNEPQAWLSLNLTIAQLKSLMFIKHTENANFKMLATALEVSPPNVTGIVERMVEQGLITREENPQNRRMLMLKVTEKGDRIATEIQEHGVHQLAGMLSQLNPEDLQALTKGFAALVRAAEARLVAQQARSLKPEA